MRALAVDRRAVRSCERHTRTVYLAGILALTTLASACFRGDDTMGAVCESSSDCGDAQSCVAGVCGRCGDGAVDSGELCLEKVSEELIGGGAVVMLPADVDGNDIVDIITIVNVDCGPGGMNLTCWNLTLLLGVGGGEYQIGNAVEELPGEVVDLVIGDFDGDMVDDSVVAFAELSTLLISLQTGVAEEPVTIQLALPTIVGSLAVGDFNGDGADDIAAASASTDEIYIGSEVDGVPMVISTLNAAAAARLLPSADINGDGNLDLVALSSFPRSVQVFLGDGQGGFLKVQELAVADTGPEGFVYDGALGDIDGDGSIDVVVVDPGGPTFYVGLNDGVAPFEELTSYPSVGFPTGVALGDFDGDQDLDLVLSDAADDRLRLHRGDGGEFLPPIEIVTSFAPFAILNTDLDGNGADDLAISNLTGTVAIVLSRN